MLAAAAAAATDNPPTLRKENPMFFLPSLSFFFLHPTPCFLAFQVLQQLVCCDGQR